MSTPSEMIFTKDREALTVLMPKNLDYAPAPHTGTTRDLPPATTRSK